jgi:hypothetical protein
MNDYVFVLQQSVLQYVVIVILTLNPKEGAYTFRLSVPVARAFYWHTAVPSIATTASCSTPSPIYLFPTSSTWCSALLAHTKWLAICVGSRKYGDPFVYASSADRLS